MSGDLLYVLQRGETEPESQGEREAEKKDEYRSASVEAGSSSLMTGKESLTSTASSVAGAHQPPTSTAPPVPSITHASITDTPSTQLANSEAACDVALDTTTAAATFSHYEELCVHGLAALSPHSSEPATPALTLCIALNRLLLDSGYALAEVYST